MGSHKKGKGEGGGAKLIREGGTLGAGRELLKLCFLSVKKFKGKCKTFLEESGVIPPRNKARNMLHGRGGSNKRKISLEQWLELLLSITPQCLCYEI